MTGNYLDRFTRRQIIELTTANLKIRYRKTFAGFIWVVANPLMMFGVQSLVFQHFLKLQIDNLALFLLTGLVPWIFVVQSLEMGTSALLTFGSLIKSLKTHPLIYLTSQIVDNLINFMTVFFALFLFIVPDTHFALLNVLLVPLPIATLLAGVLGLVWILSVMQVFWGDTKFIVSFVLNISFFLTSIFYPMNFVPNHLQFLVLYNPFYRLLAPFRSLLYAQDLSLFWEQMIYSTLTAAIINSIAWLYWRAKKNEVFFHV